MTILRSRETGPGKGMMARRIHDCSPRNVKQFDIIRLCRFCCPTQHSENGLGRFFVVTAG